MILALRADGTTLVGMSAVSVFGIDASGRTAWKNDYGKKRKVMFDSPPLVRNGRVYCVANDRIIVLDARSGRELRRVDSSGILSYGFTMVASGNKGYVPYPEGVYVFGFDNLGLDREPLVAWENATTPLVIGSEIYLASFVSPVLARFDARGKQSGTVALESICMAPPVAIGGFVFAGDMIGTLYKVGSNMELAGSRSFGGGVTSIVPVGARLFVQTASGEAYLVDVDSLDVAATFALGGRPDEKASLYRKPLVKNGYVIIGTDSGELCLIDAERGVVEQVKTLAGTIVYCTPVEFRGKLYAGTRDGRVIKIGIDRQ